MEYYSHSYRTKVGTNLGRAWKYRVY